MDMGIHEIRLAIWEGNGNGAFTADPATIGEWLNAPPLVWPHLPIG
jgi:hypothetical protein